MADITYQIESCHNAKMRIVHVDHLKPVEGNGYTNEMLDEEGDSFAGLFESETSNGALNLESGDERVRDDDIGTVDNETSSLKEETVLFPKFSSRGRRLKPKQPYSP